MTITPGNNLLPEYLQRFLSSPEAVSALEANSVGSTMVNLNQGILRRLEIRLPSLEEQQQIVTRINVAFARIDRMAEEAASATHLLGRLDEQLLAKAFRGDLVPQDPADEPAEALLARIHEGRAEVPKPKRGRRRKREAAA